MQFEIGQMLPSKSDEKIFFKKTIFTNTTSPTVELSNGRCILVRKLYYTGVRS